MNKVARCIKCILCVLLYIFSTTLFAQETGNEKIITFETNISTLSKKNKQFLDSLLVAKEINKRQYILIYGYSDNSTDKKQCESVSKARAKAVKNYLISKGLYDYNFLICSGLGLIDSLAQNMSSSESSKYFNKVELINENIKIVNLVTARLKKCLVAEMANITEIPLLNNDTYFENRHSTFDEKTISVKLPNGDEFFGTLNTKNKKTDYGVYLWANGEKYAGEFKNDKKDGHGVYKWKTGEYFEGEWKNDQPISGVYKPKLTGKYLLKVLTDKDCTIFINGECKGEIKTGVLSKFFLKIGTYKIKISSIEDTNNIFTVYYVVKGYGKEDLLTVKLTDNIFYATPKATVQINDTSNKKTLFDVKSESTVQANNQQIATTNTTPQIDTLEKQIKHKKKQSKKKLETSSLPKTEKPKVDTVSITVQSPQNQSTKETMIDTVVKPKQVETTTSNIQPNIDTTTKIADKPIVVSNSKKTSKHNKKLHRKTTNPSNPREIEPDNEPNEAIDNNTKPQIDYIVISPFQTFDTSNNMVYVDGGTFAMGSDSGGIETKPVHSVTLSSYYICKYEVTVGEFRKFIKATGYRTSADQDKTSWVFSYKEDTSNEKFLKKQLNINWEYDENGIKRTSTQDHLPVLHVSWFDATKYCEWLTKITGKKYRLPTEAEWEFAAKGGKKGVLNTNEIQSHINTLGLKNINGEIWEWCSDWYEIEYYSQSPSQNPEGPAIGSMKVLRGGSWARCTGINRNTCRFYNYAEVSGCYIGFRLAKSN